MLVVSFLYRFQPTMPATSARITTSVPMITEARDTPGSFRFRMLKIVDIGSAPIPAIRAGGTAGCLAAAACPPGPRRGPVPAAAADPVSAGGSGAMPGVKSGGAGSGLNGTVRAPGEARAAAATGAPGMSGGI